MELNLLASGGLQCCCCPHQNQKLGKQVEGNQFEKSLHCLSSAREHVTTFPPWLCYLIATPDSLSALLLHVLCCKISNISASHTQTASLFTFWLGLTNRRHWWENDGVGKGKDWGIYSSSYSIWEVVLVLAAFFYIR